MSGSEIYAEICAASNLDAAVSRLTRGELAELAVHLSGLRPTGGVPAQVFGMVSARLDAAGRRRKGKGEKS